MFTAAHLIGRVHGDMGTGCLEKSVWAIITILNLDTDAHRGTFVLSTEQMYIQNSPFALSIYHLLTKF